MNFKREEEVEVEFPQLGRISIKQHKMTPEELEESKHRSRAYQKLLEAVKSSGRWWELWEREETKDFLSRLKCEETAKDAIEELRKVFTEKWFKSSPEDHPIKFWLLNPSPYSLGEIVPLGSAIKVLGGAENLHPQALSDLQSKQNFHHRAYELEVLAFLKIQNPSIILEHELSTDKSSKKPDARVGDTYFEIKCLSTSEQETERHEITREIINAISQRFKEFRGTVGYTVDLGNPKDLEELREAIEIVKETVSNIEVKAGHQVITKDRIKIEIKVVPSNIKACLGSVTNAGQPEIWEIYRIIRKLKESAVKNPGDLPIIVIIRPSLPLVMLADESIREVVEKAIFQQAYSREPKVRTVKELWIDLTVIDSRMLKKMLSNATLSLLRVFIKLSNPFFE